MDWNAVIERNHNALKRILAMLVAMAGPVDGGSNTIARHLHCAVLRLLRPAEAAARRLIIVAAREIVIILPPPCPRKPKSKPVVDILRGLGIAVVMSPAAFARIAAKAAPAHAVRSRRLSLVDPLRLPRRIMPRHVPARATPRISFDGYSTRHPLPPRPSPNDLLDATRLGLRLQALASALDDLPGHARRFARWRARSEARRVRRISPLKPGRAPGSRRRPRHEVHEVLADMQHFALEALKPHDTS